VAVVRKDIGSGWVKCFDQVTWVNLDQVSRLIKVEDAPDDWDLFAYIVGAETQGDPAKQITVRDAATEDEMDEIWEALQDSMQVVDVPAIIEGGGLDGGAPSVGSSLGHGWILCEDENTLVNLDNVTRLTWIVVEALEDQLVAHIRGAETAAEAAVTVLVVTEQEGEDVIEAVIDALEDSMQLVKIVESVDAEE